ncbi:MAG: DUF5060 domain-containing protein [bacterium]|nr:DUF5060 domain-containing protein [bacterium]
MKHYQHAISLSVFFICSLFLLSSASPAELGRTAVYHVFEIHFSGPAMGPGDAPARDVELSARIRHESGSAEYTLQGFWNSDGAGGMRGGRYAIRFCPTQPGRWTIVETASNQPELRGQHGGDDIVAEQSDHPGFWLVDSDTPGRRWYKRSDGSHPYIFGNTHYSFLSGYKYEGRLTGNDIKKDVEQNAAYFKKLRFTLFGDLYPNPYEKPFLDDDGKPTDSGDYSFRPNPRWFHQRVDLAVQTAFDCDLIADLILAGPDRLESRSTLRAAANGADPSPYLRYIAARYGSYPNVWLCLCNEYEIKTPKYTEADIARFGALIRSSLPYPTPLSVHSTPRTLWSPEFLTLPEWADHRIIQNKIRRLAPASDVMQSVWNDAQARPMPTINDELSYEGEGDRHSEEDTIESHLGAFLGGGYATTGEKSGVKLGQYFVGGFDPAIHHAADNLKWLREIIDSNISFYRMAPGSNVFSNLPDDFRVLSNPGKEYALGSCHEAKSIQAHLGSGAWRVVLYDVINMKANTLSEDATGTFEFGAPKSRAALIHFKRVE